MAVAGADPSTVRTALVLFFCAAASSPVIIQIWESPVLVKSLLGNSYWKNVWGPFASLCLIVEKLLEQIDSVRF